MPLICPSYLQRGRRFRAACADLGLLVLFLPIFFIGWAVILISDARQRRINHEEGDGE